MEVLTAYVRKNARWSPEESSGPTTAANEVAGPNSPQEPPADIRAIVDVIRRREEDRIPEKDRVALDLRRTNLEGANLEGADLRGRGLEGAKLRGVKGLTQKQLEDAIGNAKTELPAGLDRPTWWAQGENERTGENEQP